MKLPESWTTVTTLSKTIALGMLVVLPFGGFYFGYQYHQKISVACPAPDNNPAVLSVISLNTDYGIDTPSPVYSPNISVYLPSSLVNSVGAYGVADKIIFGPKGWTGEGHVGADGTSSISLYPQNKTTTENVTITDGSACMGCVLGGAAPFFSSAKSKYEENFGQYEGKKLTNLKITPISQSLVKYTYVADNGLSTTGVAYYLDSSDQPEFRNIEVTLSSDKSELSTFILNNFIEANGLK